MKKDQLDDFVLTEYNQLHGVRESQDSSNKKVIFEIPFNEIEVISNLLEQLQAQFGDKCYIDIEMNSLEDAYLHIAREEEKLLAAMKESSQQEKRSTLISNYY